MRTPLQILLGAVVLGTSGLAAKWMVDHRPRVEPEPVTVPAPLVQVLTVRPTPFRRRVHARGEVQPRERISLVSEVDGRVVSLSPNLVTGGAFGAGEVLVELDPREYELARTGAAAGAREATTALTREEIEAQVAREELQALGESEASALALHEPQLAEARARLAAAEAALARADLDLARTRLAAPWAGRVASESASVGQFVARGQVLAELFATDVAEVRLAVPDAELAHLDLDFDPGRGGPPVTLSAPFAGELHHWRGRVVRLEAQIDRRSRMVILVVEVRDPYGDGGDGGHGGDGTGTGRAPLMSGLFVEALIEGREDPAAVRLPRSALFGESRLLVVDSESRLRFRTVEVVWRHGDEVAVRAGLEAGERVCTSPLAAPVDGMRVRVEDGP